MSLIHFIPYSLTYPVPFSEATMRPNPRWATLQLHPTGLMKYVGARENGECLPRPSCSCRHMDDLVAEDLWL
jgi:hypothetical protein